ncbi:hypothetical protein TWF506_004413 [Arthrobotrys conoides]|uniref:BTB domain-containing protein n=1 Tax=Arthrobotrys conoides TaxID=74498 RepID=A0AAN8RIK1_9PEZI
MSALKRTANDLEASSGNASIPHIRMTPDQARERDLKRLAPGDKYADQMFAIGAEKKIYHLHTAIAGPQSIFIEQELDKLKQMKTNRGVTTVEWASVHTFDRIVAWLYSAKGATPTDDLKELGNLYRSARHFGIAPLRFQILAMISSPAYKTKFPGENKEVAIGLLELAYSSASDKDYLDCSEILGDLCTKLVLSMSVRDVVELLEGRRADQAFKKSIRDRLGATKIVFTPEVGDGATPGSAAKKRKVTLRLTQGSL